VKAAGFRVGAISGAGASESRPGWADRGVMTFEVNLENARRPADCTDTLLLRAFGRNIRTDSGRTGIAQCMPRVA
jgi:hypothetical protein